MANCGGVVNKQGSLLPTWWYRLRPGMGNVSRIIWELILFSIPEFVVGGYATHNYSWCTIIAKNLQ